MKKFVIMLVMTAVAEVTQAAYLYWQVNADDAPSIAFESARVVAIKDGATVVLDFAEDGNTKTDYSVVDKGYGAVIKLDQLTDASSYSFYIELVNYNSATLNYDVVGTSLNSAQSYTQLVSSKFIDEGNMGMPITPASVWHGGTFAVPEPTGTLMVMMGLGLLALKRRKV